MVEVITDDQNRRLVLEKYGKTVEDLQNDVDSIILWLKNQPHLPMMRVRKIELLLLNCKFRKERLKRIIDAHYTLRNYIPEIYENWDPLTPEIQNSLHTGAVIILPKLNPIDLGRVLIGRLLDTDPDKFHVWECLKTLLMIYEVSTESVLSNGLHFICDMEGVTFSHLTKFTPMMMKKSVTIVTEAYSVKVLGIHILNAPSSINILLNVLKLVFKPKLYEKINIHNNFESLHEIISKDILPEDYLGKDLPYQKIHGKLVKKMEHSRLFLINELQLRSDESKRVDASKGDTFGSVHGTFKKLDID